MKTKLVFSLLFLFLFLVSGCSENKKTTEIVEGYLTAVKNGDDPEKFIDIGVDELIDVFEYEYLKELDTPKDKDTNVYTYEFWQEFDVDNFADFIMYKNYYKDLYKEYEILRDDNDVLELWDGKSYVDKKKLLYNVTLANEKGEKLFKKVEFTVEYSKFIWDGEDYVEGYQISDIDIR